eukprot:1249528-Rhodomonas_salina.1
MLPGLRDPRERQPPHRHRQSPAPGSGPAPYSHSHSAGSKAARGADVPLLNLDKGSYSVPSEAVRYSRKRIWWYQADPNVADERNNTPYQPRNRLRAG